MQLRIEIEGQGAFIRRTGLPLNIVRGLLEGRDSQFTNVVKIAEAVDMECYVGPPRSGGQGASDGNQNAERLARLLDTYMSIKSSDAKDVFVEMCQVMAEKKPKIGGRSKQRR
ncbi:MAG: hypothetical protein JKY61_07500 [Planctomycetes bacterium]|nr:hypothetical protein [Planctomycetota bacterium]